jgi:hypothetical protein
MGSAKEIKLKVIPSKIANDFVTKYHYSKSYVRNSTLHFGAFYKNRLHGVLQYGNSIDKRNCIGFVKNTQWNEFIELNRMAFDDILPKNSESRCISISIKLIKKYAPQIKWILSYADGTQCGDGTIYRASGFYLTGINKNNTIYKFPNGKTKAKHGTSKIDFSQAKKMDGYQFRYIYLIDKKSELNLDIIPYDKIKELGISMYKGKLRASR